MIEALIKAEKECTKRIDINPDKILRPIGTTFREWIEPFSSTKLPYWVTWRIIGYIEEFKGRRGDMICYERMEEIESI